MDAAAEKTTCSVPQKLLCVACGCDLTHRVGERCSLLSPTGSAMDVLALWKSLCISQLQLAVPDDLYGGKMCRKCPGACE